MNLDKPRKPVTEGGPADERLVVGEKTPWVQHMLGDPERRRTLSKLVRDGRPGDEQPR